MRFLPCQILLTSSKDELVSPVNNMITNNTYQTLHKQTMNY